jgi:hypothetical protein
MEYNYGSDASEDDEEELLEASGDGEMEEDTAEDIDEDDFGYTALELPAALDFLQEQQIEVMVVNARPHGPLMLSSHDLRKLPVCLLVLLAFPSLASLMLACCCLGSHSPLLLGLLALSKTSGR